jgi:outer membrane protein assembly factor BamB
VVVSLNPRDGKELWRCRYSGYSVVPRPVYGHGLVFIATGYDEPGLIAVKVDGKGDVTDSHIAWRTDRGAPLNPSPLLVGDELYLVSDNGIASCLEARTGKVHWRERLGGNFSASPLSAAGYVYFQDEEGIGAVVRAGKEFQKVGKNDLGERTLASYACAERAFFIRTEKHVYRIQKE